MIDVSGSAPRTRLLVAGGVIIVWGALAVLGAAGRPELVIMVGTPPVWGR
ncbi:hypothetical protein [Pseudonocardia yunnanensis]|uniref:EamA family transporter n=1 Tax=Pseudonocardia yunnanensis TaxID=58107 RepID=A0ABW4EZD5_9PSEU